MTNNKFGDERVTAPEKHLVLIGYRGSGKSAVARRLGLALGCPWIDTDVEVELRAGKSIRALFDEEGEEAFRDLESRVVADLGERGPQVVAVGGGAVLREENRRRLGEAGDVVWLRASPETLHERTSADSTTPDRRPPLSPSGGLTEIREVLARRTPIYRESAQLEVDTEGKSPSDVAEEILRRLGLEPAPPG